MPISVEQFKDTMRQFAAGVTIVTVKAGEEVHGMTVSAFVSVSAAPPLVAVVINQNSRGHALLERPGAVFAANILQEAQKPLANRFAFMEDRFAEGEWSTAVTGAPVLTDALAWVDCTIYQHCQLGTHTMYIGEVQASYAAQHSDERPLVYWNRDYRKIAVPHLELNPLELAAV